ncbi:MAG: hypothetical protein ACLFM0_05775 [Spirochaetales bacterium]
MAIRIDKPIVDYRVRKNDPPQEAASEDSPNARQSTAEPGNAVISMDETLERPYELKGTTYKVKTPVSDHAMYITINDIVLNEGTESEVRRPFEIFINSKNLDHFQWIVALTRIISAVFRKGGDVAFLVEELKAVFDPRGGYWKTGGKYMPSLIAEIGEVIERHLMSIGLIRSKEGLTDEQREMLEEKRTEYESRSFGSPAREPDSTNGHAGAEPAVPENEGEAGASPFPAGATLCPKCNTAAVVVLDGCRTCLNCGDSKCN